MCLNINDLKSIKYKILVGRYIDKYIFIIENHLQNKQ